MTMQDFAGAEPTKKQSIEDYKEFQNAFGVNDKLYEKQRARQDEQAADIEKQKSTAGWLALANAGFAAAASPSPFLFQGIATGGIKGLTEYNTAMEKLQDRQDKLDAARFNLDDAENKFKQSGSTAALGDYRDALKAHKTAQQKYIEVKTNADYKGAEIATQARGQDLTYKAAMDSHRTMLEQAKIYSQGGAKNTDRILDNLKDLNDPKRYENVMRDAALPNPGNNPVLAKKIADAKQVLAERQELINFNKSLLGGAGGSGVGGVGAASKQTVTMADIQSTARKYGKSVEQVKADALAKGYVIQ
ncbi:MAG: hypothetical protein EBR82_64790 [Caulobacteraceae bacterium]|nr:hypothetical protein [Caulobacteraceae bacterium]